MKTKKYTTHLLFWIYTATFIVFSIMVYSVYRKYPSTIYLVISFIVLLSYLVFIIKDGLAWHSYVEISDEGVKMKGCAKRISEDKTETVDDIFIPWGDIEEINGGPALELKTGETIKLTQRINVSDQALQKAFEQYKSEHRQDEPEQSPDSIVSVISEIDNGDKL